MKKIMIGCDPEFMILTNNRALPAKEICEDWEHENHFGEEVGQGGYVFELRPDPSTDVFSLLANIRKILRIHIEKFPYLKKCIFVGGHTVRTNIHHTKNKDFVIGGHIHIGATDDKYDTDYEEDLKCPRFKNFLNKIIHDGFMYIINDKEGQDLRRIRGYGKEHDFRHRVFSIIEYRTPPSWLVSPTLAFVFLTLAKICGLLFVNRKIWRIDTAITNIIKGEDRGLVLLRKLFHIVNKEMRREEDIAKCLKVLDNLPNKVKLLPWQRNFLTAWNL